MSKLNYAPIANLTSEKKLNAFIETSLSGFETAREMIQMAMVAILAHFIASGNWQIDRVNQFCTDKRLSGAQTNLITAWFAKYGGYTRKPGESGFTGHVTDGKEDTSKVSYVKKLFQEAKDNHWYTPAIGQDVFKSFDLSEEVTKFVKKVAKKQREATKTGNTDKVDLTLSEAALQQLLNVAKIESLIVLHNDKISVEKSANDATESADDADIIPVLEQEEEAEAVAA